MVLNNFISIITVSYNSEITITKTINSVLNQNIINYEYIIIDGGSSDGSVDYLRSKSKFTYWISEPDNGIYDALNKGIEISNGEITSSKSESGIED